MEDKHALIIIDVQSLFVKNTGQETINHIHRLIDSKTYDLIISTIFVNSLGSKYEKALNYSGGTNVKDQILDQKVLSASDYIFEKEAYAPGNSFLQTLSSENVTKVTIVGIDTDGCVLATAFKCFDADIETFIDLAGCTSTGGKRLDTAARLIMKRSFGQSHLLNYEHN